MDCDSKVGGGGGEVPFDCFWILDDTVLAFVAAELTKRVGNPVGRRMLHAGEDSRAFLTGAW